MKTLPKKLLIYVCEKLEDGTPIYAVAVNVEDIPEDAEGERVGVYYLNATHTFKMKRQLV